MIIKFLRRKVVGKIVLILAILVVSVGFYFFQTISQNSYSIFQNYFEHSEQDAPAQQGHPALSDERGHHGNDHDSHIAITQDFLIRVDGKSTFKADERPILKLAEEFDLARNAIKRPTALQQNNGGVSGFFKNIFSKIVKVAIPRAALGDEPEGGWLRVAIKNADDQPADIGSSVEYNNGQTEIKFESDKNSFRPGAYTAEVTIEKDGIIYTDTEEFVWGVLAINTDKSVYMPGETAYIQIGALDKFGHTLCNANLKLTVSLLGSPEAVVTTKDGSINKSGQCNGNNVTTAPDYFVNMEIESRAQIISKTPIRMKLTNLDNGYEIESVFEVWPKTEYSVQRTGPTRIFPLAPYDMTISVKSKNGFKGQIIESVPEDFIVVQTGEYFFNLVEDKLGRQKKLIWEVDLAAGKEAQLSYRFDAPDRSPELYLLGPLLLRHSSDESQNFAESRQWQIASDITDRMILFLDPADSVPDGWTSISGSTGAMDNKFPVGSASYGGTGGASTHTHTGTSASGLSADSARDDANGPSTNSATAHDHSDPATTVDSPDSRPKFGSLIMIKSDAAPSSIPQNAIAMFDTTPPAGWTAYTTIDDRIIVASGSAGTNGGADSHTHTANPDDLTSAGGAVKLNGSGANVAIGTHTHTVSSKTSSTSYNVPLHASVILAKANAGGVSDFAGVIAMFDATPDSNEWNVLSGTGGAFAGAFIEASTSYKMVSENGGASTHTHSGLYIISGAGSGTNAAGASTGLIVSTHTHKVDVSFSTNDHRPAYKGIIIAKYITVPNLEQIHTRWRNDDGVETGDWYNASWMYRRKFTVDFNKVGSASDTFHSNFAVLVSTSHADFKQFQFGGGVASKSGGDIVFTDSTGTTKISHEIEKYSSSSGQVIAWVKIASLSASTDSSFYMYYGNASTSDQWDTTNVWNSAYKGVWHLGEDVTDEATGGTHTDSTSNANNATQNNNAEAISKINYGQDFDGTGDYASKSDPVNGSLDAGNTDDLTLSGWFNTDVSATTYHILSKGDYNVVAQEDGKIYDVSLIVSSGLKLSMTVSDGTSDGTHDYHATSATTISTGSWYYFTFIWDQDSAENTELYLNGTDDNATESGTITDVGDTSNALAFEIGRATDAGTPIGYFNGKLDEIRVSKTVRSADWIKTEYNNQNSASTFYAMGVQEQQGWYNDLWNYRQRFSINFSKVGSASDQFHSNFPVLVSASYSALKSELNGGHVASGSGGDILFTLSDGTTKVPHEIEKYASTSGQLFAWVKVASLSATADTTIFMYYGTSSTSYRNQWDPPNVWNSAFKGVWHLGETVTDEQTSGIHQDSTSNNNDGTQNGNDDIAGKIGLAQDLDGNDIILMDNPTGVSSITDFTVSLWVNQDILNAEVPFAGIDPGLTDDIAIEAKGTGLPITYINNVAVFTNANSYGATNWYYWVLKRSGSTINFYQNGVVDPNSATNATVLDISNCINLANDNCSTGTFNGKIDEVRFATDDRSADWITTEYNNQNSAGTFFAVGASEELFSVTASVTFSTAGNESWTVPDNVASITVKTWGAGGGRGGNGGCCAGGAGGGGGFAQSTISVTSGQNLDIYVGGGGVYGVVQGRGAGGGGYSAVVFSSTYLIQAGGGGGGGGGNSGGGSTGGAGGAGGGVDGVDGTNGGAGLGNKGLKGTSSAGGSGGIGASSPDGAAGDANTGGAGGAGSGGTGGGGSGGTNGGGSGGNITGGVAGGGGGGAGRFGGGGGVASSGGGCGGGGGSSLVTGTNTVETAGSGVTPGNSTGDVDYTGTVGVGSSTAGVAGSNGYVVIYYTTVFSESQNASYAAAQNTKLTNLAKLTTKRLRIEISNEGGQASTPQLRLEVSGANPASCAAASYTRVDTDTHWDTALSSYFADGASTSNVAGLTDMGPAFQDGQSKESSDTTSGITLTGDGGGATTAEFTEVEYSLQATSSATDGASYCFRLTNAGSTTNFTYTKYASVSLEASAAINISGRVYTDEGSTGLSCAVTKTVAIKVNGAGSTTVECSNTPDNGTYSFSSISASAGNVLTIFLDGESEKGVIVTKANADNMTGIGIFQDHVIASGSITIANMNQYDQGNDSDIYFTATDSSPDTLVVSSSHELYIPAGSTFTPGGNVNVKDIKILGTYTATGGEGASVSGTFTNSGTFTAATGTVELASSSIDGTIAGTSLTTFYNFTSTAAGKNIIFPHTSSTTFSNTLTITGDPGNPVFIKSSQTSTQWKLNLTGSAVATYLKIQDSGCQTGTVSVDLGVTGTDAGFNNTSCWAFRGIGGSGGNPTGGGSGGGTGLSGGTSGGTGGTDGGSGGGTGVSGGTPGGSGGNPSPILIWRFLEGLKYGYASIIGVLLR